MIRYIASLIFGWLGLGLTISVACGLAYWFIPPVPWLTDKLRQLLLTVCIASAVCTLAFAKGVHTGTVLHREKVEREIKDAVATGNAAKEKALRDFDNSPTIPDDGFARPD